MTKSSGKWYNFIIVYFTSYRVPLLNFKSLAKTALKSWKFGVGVQNTLDLYSGTVLTFLQSRETITLTSKITQRCSSSAKCKAHKTNYFKFYKMQYFLQISCLMGVLQLVCYCIKLSESQKRLRQWIRNMHHRKQYHESGSRCWAVGTRVNACVNTSKTWWQLTLTTTQILKC